MATVKVTDGSKEITVFPGGKGADGVTFQVTNGSITVPDEQATEVANLLGTEVVSETTKTTSQEGK